MAKAAVSQGIGQHRAFFGCDIEVDRWCGVADAGGEVADRPEHAAGARCSPGSAESFDDTSDGVGAAVGRVGDIVQSDRADLSSLKIRRARQSENPSWIAGALAVELQAVIFEQRRKPWGER